MGEGGGACFFGAPGLHFRGGGVGGSIEPPKTGGWFQEKGSIDRHR